MHTFIKRHLLLAIVLLAGAIHLYASPVRNSEQSINRRAVVARHNPHITSIDTLGSLTVGNGGFAVTVDATGLQTFPEYYSKGVPLGTMSNWGWHSFPNTGNYKLQDVLRSYDFGRGHKEVYAVQVKEEGRGKKATDWLRVNPHRLHLGCVGFNFANPSEISGIDQALDLWTGCISSRFRHNRQQFTVQTACDPDADALASRIESQSPFKLLLRFPYPTGAHADDACDWTSTRHKVVVIDKGKNFITLKHILDDTHYYILWKWQGKAKVSQLSDYCFELSGKSLVLEFSVNYSADIDNISNRPASFSDIREASAKATAKFWSTGRFLDFGAVKDPRAKELERRVILSQYLMNIQECGSMPPQETGLTYNSWFGKFHLEMAWWHLAHWGMWGKPDHLDRPMRWYIAHTDSARSIARRQGFKGIRWMKMTDPNAGEAPSNVGSFLIWQQPEPILLAELLYKSTDNGKRKEVLERYKEMVSETAEFMGDFVQKDSTGIYHLQRYIPAQESLNKDSVADSPLELAEWHQALSIAQKWRERQGLNRRADWDDIIDNLTPLAYNSDSLYLASATTPNSYTYIRYISDHPAVLGAYGVMPPSRLVNAGIMRHTADWIFKNWNWPTSWGWDFPMMAMTYARLGDGEKAVDALLMKAPKNTYLVNGHNWQSDRLRIYMPGNGGLLSAVALMSDLHMFPKGWNVKESIR